MSLKKMSAKKLSKIVLNHEQLFVLDVRNTDDYTDWKIEGKNIKTFNVPYFDLIDGIDMIISQLPHKNDPVLVVCAKEGSSIFVGEMLVEAGYEKVSYLSGGMASWNDHLEPMKIGDLPTGGTIYQFLRLGKGCLTYLIKSGKEAIIIDPVRIIEPILQFAKEKELQIKHVIDTHLHADHISGGRAIREKTSAIYWLPPKDAEEVVYDYEPLTEQSDISLNKNQTLLQVVYTPGHTIGSTSIIVGDQYLLTGDVLFVESIGRPDLAGKAGEWAKQLRTTLYQDYRTMSEDLIVLPAHFASLNELHKDGGVQEKLGVLFNINGGLNITDEQQFNDHVSENLPPQPNSFQQIREVNMGKTMPNFVKQKEMEIGPNRCAI